MRLELGDKVLTGDGQDAGTLDWLILDPACLAVKSVVLHRGLILGRSVETPLSLLQPGQDDTLRLGCTAEQVDGLPEFFAATYSTSPPAYGSPLDSPAERLAWPLGPTVTQPPLAGHGAGVDSATRQEIDAAWRQQDAQNAVLGAGSTVRGRDGEKVGTVHGLIVDPLSGQVTRVVVRTGLFGGKDVELPAALIARVDDDVLDLTVPARDVSS